MEKKIRLKILRGTTGFQYWETFEITMRPMLNVITALMEIQENPVNIEGKTVCPVAWEQACLEQVCGSCSMLVNGRPRQACSTIINDLVEKSGSYTITIAPLTKFPLIRDLVVDRSILFERLKKIKAWVPVKGLNPKGDEAKVLPDKQQVEYKLSTCMSCTCCLEACPQYHPQSPFVGAAIIGQAHLFDLKEPNATTKERLHTMMEEGGVSHCGKAMNCKEVCPSGIELTRSIAAVGKRVTEQAFQDFFGDPDTDQ